MASFEHMQRHQMRKIGHYLNPVRYVKIEGVPLEIEHFDTIGRMRWFRVTDERTARPVVPSVVGDDFDDIEGYLRANWDRVA